MRRYHAQSARFSSRVLLAYAQPALAQTFALRPRAADTPAEILLYDEIGFWGVTARDFQSMLAQVGDGPLTLRINSPGGDVFDGLAIFSALQSHAGDVTVIVDGLAASAASFIALAGDRVTMAENAFLMVHNAWTLALGNKNDLAASAAVLGKIDAQMAQIYAKKTGDSVEAMAALMDAETWLTAAEAQSAGFIDAVDVSDRAAAAARLKEGAFARNIPAPQNSTPSGGTDLIESNGMALAARQRLLRLAEAEAL